VAPLLPSLLCTLSEITERRSFLSPAFSPSTAFVLLLLLVVDVVVVVVVVEVVVEFTGVADIPAPPTCLKLKGLLSTNSSYSDVGW